VSTIRVVAIEEAFYDGARVRRGAVFDMPESAMKKREDGTPILPRWVIVDSPESRDYVASIKGDAEAAQLAGTLAAAGKRAVVKHLGER